MLAPCSSPTNATVRRLNDLPKASFNGSYAFASLFLTGETRPYLVEEGEFDRIVPKSSIGAWEIAARVSGIDLNDPSVGVNVLGGKAPKTPVNREVVEQKALK